MFETLAGSFGRATVSAILYNVFGLELHKTDEGDFFFNAVISGAFSLQVKWDWENIYLTFPSKTLDDFSKIFGKIPESEIFKIKEEEPLKVSCTIAMFLTVEQPIPI